MSSSSSPPNFQNTHLAGSSGHDGNDKGPLNTLNSGLIKSLADKRTTTRDGQPAKRRGPKPDSKPALTRRQELNRQAQRTHRERKEYYIKALEDVVLRLKEVYSNVAQDKDKLAEENKQLKTLLQTNGISPAAGGGADDAMSNPSLGYSSSGSVSGSYAPGSSTTYTPPLTSLSTAPSYSPTTQMVGVQQSHGHHAHHQHARNPSQPQPRLDYEQAGIDFVLTYDNPDDPSKALEKPCMDHLPWLVDRANAPGGEACGHALMASCPPKPYAELDDTPFGYQYGGGGGGAAAAATANNNNNNAAKSGQTWELTKGDLATLLDLSRKLDLDGEITPVMAWGMILGHPRLGELRADDLHRLGDELRGKVSCFGFGAVLEEFEVRDVLNSIFSTKPELNMAF